MGIGMGDYLTIASMNKNVLPVICKCIEQRKKV